MITIIAPHVEREKLTPHKFHLLNMFWQYAFTSNFELNLPYIDNINAV